MEKNKLEQLLGKTDQEVYNPNCDIHEGKLYFGFRLRLDGREQSLFLFDDGTYKIDFLTGLLFEENQISQTGIKRFLNNERVDPQRLYKESIELAKEFLDIDDILYDLFFLWNLHTYGINLFGVTPYVHIKGTPNSGKSTVMGFCCLLTPKSEYIINPSVSSIFRGVDISQNTQFFDEVENYNEKDKRDMFSILNAGYTKGGSIVPRIDRNKDGTFKREKFKVYSPKMFASVSEIEVATFRSRTIEVYTLSTNKQVKDMINLNEEDKRRFTYLRDDYYLFWLQNWKKIKEIHDNLPDIQIYGRNLQIIKPILALAKFFGLYDSMLNFFRTEMEEKKDELVESDRNFILLKTLFDMVKRNKTYWLRVSEIVDNYNSELGDLKGFKDAYKCTNKSLGKQLKRLNLNKNKRRLSYGMEYYFDINLILDRIKRYGYDKYIDQEDVISAVSEVYVDYGIVKEEEVRNE